YEPRARTPTRLGSSPPPESAWGVPTVTPRGRRAGSLAAALIPGAERPGSLGGVPTGGVGGSLISTAVSFSIGVVIVIDVGGAKLKCPSRATTEKLCVWPAATVS